MDELLATASRSPAFKRLTVRRLGQDDLPLVASLHSRILSWSLNGRLGAGHIGALYDALFRSQGFFGYLCEDDGRLVAFSTGTTQSRAARASIVPVYRHSIGSLGAQVLRHPSYLVSLFESALLVPRAFRRCRTGGEWLTLVADTGSPFLTPFATLRLIDATRRHFADAGLATFVGQGVRRNPNVRGYYEKLRWNKIASFWIHDVYCWSASSS